MDRFEGVTVIKQANIYFEGKVTSRTVLLADGAKKTLGIMLPGEYEFGTADKEVMEILGGHLEVKLPGGQEWRSISAGETFEVPAGVKFQLRVSKVVDYCCSYLK